MYVWMDFSCIDQDIPAEELQSYHNSKIRGINSLPVYIYLCSSFVTIDHPEYASRAWCRCVPHIPFPIPSQPKPPDARLLGAQAGDVLREVLRAASASGAGRRCSRRCEFLDEALCEE